MIRIHKRLMMSLKRSHAIWKILEKSVPSFIYINSSLSEYDPLEISNEGLSSHSTPLWKISLHQLFRRQIPKGRVNAYEESFGVFDFFFLFTFILIKGQVRFLCLPSISVASQANTWINHRRTDDSIHPKNTLQILFFFYISAQLLQVFVLLKGCKRHQFSFFHILLLLQI